MNVPDESNEPSPENARRGTEPSVLRLARFAVLGGFAATGLFGLWVIFTRLNPLQIDAAGHVASAWTLREGFFHRFHDGFFLGAVPNLSYPPLEDAILVVLGALTGGDLFAAYPIYLGLLLIAYLAALIYLAFSVFRSDAARVFFLLVSLFLLHADKPGLTYFQGLSLIDLLVTGLAAEVLSFVFCLLLLVDLIRSGPWLRVALWLFLALSSHLVVGPVSLVLVLAYAVIGRRRELFGSFGLAMFGASYFLLPFLEARGHFFASTIFKSHPYFMPTLAVFAIVFLARDRHWLPIAGTSLAIALPTELYQLFTRWFGDSLLPAYHYYRLAILSLFLLAVAVAALLDRESARRASGESRNWDKTVVVLAGLLLAFLLRDFRPMTFDFEEPRFTPPPLTSEIELPESEEIQRVFVIHPERPCDFYLDTFFIARGSAARFNKGLYWESSRNNTVLSSYLATLLDTSSLVLDYWYYTSPTCPELQCFFDHFARDFNVGWVLAPRSEAPSYLDAEKAACYNQLLQGTPGFEIHRTDGGSIGGRLYDLYALAPRSDGRRTMDHRILEVVAWDDLRSVDAADPQFFAKPMESVFEACRADATSQIVFVFDKDFRQLQQEVERRTPQELDSARSGAAMTFRKIDRGTYALRVDADRPVLFRIKLSHFPGFELVQAGDEGKRLPLYDAVGSMIGLGHGDMVLRHRRTGMMWTGYLLSLGTLVGVLGICLRSGLRSQYRRVR